MTYEVPSLPTLFGGRRDTHTLGTRPKTMGMSIKVRRFGMGPLGTHKGHVWRHDGVECIIFKFLWVNMFYFEYFGLEV